MAAPKRVKAVEPDSVREPIGEDVVDSLPYVLVVVQVDHTISSTNAAARRFLPQLEDARHCHEAFSCRTPGGPCDLGYLAAPPLPRQAPLPEVRLDIPPGPRLA